VGIDRGRTLEALPEGKRISTMTASGRKGMKVASKVNGRLRPESGIPAAVNFSTVWYENGQNRNFRKRASEAVPDQVLKSICNP